MDKETQDREWKKILAEFMRKLQIIRDKFTGTITIGFNDGGIRNVTKTEVL